MVTRRSRPHSGPHPSTKGAVPASGPKHLDALMSAAIDGLTVTGAALHRQSVCGNTFWVSGGNQFDLARDPNTGDVLMRIGAEVFSLCAAELATLGGMLLAASMLQGIIEDKGNNVE